MARAVRRALAEEAGGVLAFLPGVAEIERTAERLADVPGVSLQPAPRLARSGGAARGDRARGRTQAGARDLDRGDQPDHRRGAGGGRQRAGAAATLRSRGGDDPARHRAREPGGGDPARRGARRGRDRGSRTGCGRRRRPRGWPRFDPPEILEADLSALVLASAIWGVADPRELKWIDPPPAAAVAEARARLGVLTALDADARPTAHGRALAALPMPPRLAHMLVRAGEIGLAREAAEVAVLLGERGLGGGDIDLELRVRRWRGERGAKAEAARGLAKRWANFVSPLPAREGSGVGSSPRTGALEAGRPAPNRSLPRRGAAVAIALAYPDRIARRRDASGETWASVGGRGFRLDPASSLAREEWLAVAETGGSAAGARILSAAAIDRETVEALFAGRVETRRTVAFDGATGGVSALRERRLGSLKLSSGPDGAADPAEIAAALLAGVRAHGVALLPWSGGAGTLRTRAAYAGEPIDDAALLARADEWLPPLLAGVRRLDQIAPGALTDALRTLLGWDALRRIDRLAPADFVSPAGSTHPVDYAAEAGPTVELRPQALFGLATHPTLGDGTPLVLVLSSPAGRPIQTTRDLPGFWAGTWAAVAKEMRGRYPRHPWPDDPAAASATLRTKNADARRPGSR